MVVVVKRWISSESSREHQAVHVDLIMSALYEERLKMAAVLRVFNSPVGTCSQETRDPLPAKSKTRLASPPPKILTAGGLGEPEHRALVFPAER